MNNWDLTGMRIKGGYLAGDVKVTGTVIESRIAYGGLVRHYVKLDKGFNWKKGVVVREAGDVVIINQPNVIKVLGGIEATA